MIAIISSTLIPASFSYFSNAERLEQTILTIDKLIEKGFSQIFLLDNSVNEIDIDWIQSKTSQPINIFHSNQYNFENKGLNEALLILNHLNKIPNNEFIFKISGRYYPNEQFSKANLKESLGDKEIIGFCEDIDVDFPFFSTRSYLVKDKGVLEIMLKLAVEEMIAYARASKGVKGVAKLFKSIIFNDKIIGTPFTLSLEQAFGRIVKSKENYILAKSMNIEGFVAGSDKLDFISE